MICSASDFNSSGLSGAVSSAISSPFTRMVAGRPTLSNRSDAVRWTMCVMACLKLNVGPAACGASGMRIHPEEGLSELDRLGVFHTHFPDQPGDFGLDLVHDLHRFDDAHHLTRGDAAAALHVRRRARLGRRVERADHGRLDLDQLGLGGRAGGGGRAGRAGTERWRRRLRHRDLLLPPPPPPPPLRPLAPPWDPGWRPPPRPAPAPPHRPQPPGPPPAPPPPAR